MPPDLTDLAPGAITTVAGVGVFSGDYRPGSRAMVTPWGLAVDEQAQFDIPGIDQGGLAADDAGNLFLLDYTRSSSCSPR